MIFAPRSWPSKPGLAITTLIFVAMASAVYGGASEGHRLVPRLAEPRRGLLRLPRRGPVAARLRPWSAREIARAGTMADRRGDRDHPPPPRPLGRSHPVGLGRSLRSGGAAPEAEALAAAREPRAAPAGAEGARERGHVRQSVRGHGVP